MPPKQQQSRSNRSNRATGSHVYRRIRDPIVQDASASSLTQVPLDNSYIGNVYTLSPLGVQGLFLKQGELVTAASGIPARLPFLYNTARNFGEYRVTNAVLIFVSSLGSTVVGKVVLSGTKDCTDTGAATSQLGWSHAKTFDLASGATKEFRYPLPIDTSWKIISSQAWWKSGDVYCPANSINDLAFGVAAIATVGVSANPSTGIPDNNIGTLFVEYDVEFRQPVTPLTNK